MEKNQSEKLLQQYEPLFHKVLQRCGIYYSHPDYQDYLQILRLSFFRWSQSHQLEELSELFGFLCWQVRDHQRKEYRQQLILNKALEKEICQDLAVEEKVEVKSTIQALWQQANEGEKLFLILRLQNFSMGEIAAIAKVSRSQVFIWKRRLSKILRKILKSD